MTRLRKVTPTGTGPGSIGKLDTEEENPMKMLAMTIALTLVSGKVLAETDVAISKEMPTVTIETADGPVEIGRIQDTDNEISGEWARTSRPCPEFCIQPMTPAEGVSTIGELELIAMLQDPDALVVDSRTYDWFEGGTIPGAVNIPYTRTVDELGQMGCAPDFDGWNCSEAKHVALFCNGIWCGQSPTAIRSMIQAGFPADRISYYRGGMQVWRLLGLSVTGD